MKNEFVYTAVTNLQKAVQINAKWKKHSVNNEIDGKLELNVNNKIIVLNAVVRNELQEEDLNEIYKLAMKHVQFIVISREIFPGIKEFLRQVHVSHLEESGNIFIEQKNLFIFIEKDISAEPADTKQEEFVQRVKNSLK